MAEAFELRASHENVSGGTVTLQGGKTYDFARALSQSDGPLVVRDPELIERLREVPALKQVDVPASKPKTSPTKSDEGRS